MLMLIRRLLSPASFRVLPHGAPFSGTRPSCARSSGAGSSSAWLCGAGFSSAWLCGALLAGILLAGSPLRIQAYTFPVEHEGGPRASATFVEDHGGWHGGIDLPRSHGADIVHAVSDETVFHVYNLAFDNVQVVRDAKIGAVISPWSFELENSSNKYMLDILRVRRVTRGKDPRTYQVDHVVEVPPGSGIAQDGVVLVPDYPSPGDSLVSGDSLAVDYAYYHARIFQTAHRTDVIGEYHFYAHIDSIHRYVSWNTYPATAENRYYGTDTVVPEGRWPHVLSEGESFADIETILNFASEPRHLHYGQSSNFMFPVSTTNPLSSIGFPTDDPQGNRPYVRSLAFVYGQFQFTFASPRVYGPVNILVEARDDMGSPEAADDGDGPGDVIRQANCYNAGYWVTADSARGEDIASAARPNKMFAGNGKDTVTGQDSLNRVVLIRRLPFFVDLNTNYHMVVSHVEEDSTRFWNTRARTGGALDDGSDAPLARVNSEARFGDGRYTVHAKARDVVTYGQERDSMVVVDNFRPYVRKVVVHDDTGELYSGEWTFDGTNIVFSNTNPDDGMRDFGGNKRCADGLSDVVIEVTFSEGMKEAQMGALDPLGYTPTLHRMTPAQDSLWMAVIPKDKLKNTRGKSGRQMIEIFGKDWGDNDVREIASTTPIDPADNSRSGQTMQGPGGSDTLHRFAICQGLALVLDVTGSMYDEIEDVKEAMSQAITFQRDDPERFLNYNIVTFEDTARVRLVTKYPDVALLVLQSLQIGFGGPCPEASVAALDSLPRLMPRGGTAIFATDADPLEGRPRLDAAKARLRALDIEVNTLISGNCDAFRPAPPDTDAVARGNGGPDAARGARDNGGANAPAQDNTRPGMGDQDGRAPGQFAWENGAPVPAESRSGGGGTADPSSELFGTIDSKIAFHEVADATGGIYVESFPNAEFIGAARIIASGLGTGAHLVSRSQTLSSPSLESHTIPVDASCSELLVLLNSALGDDIILQLRRPSGAVVQPGDPDVEVNYAPAVACYHIENPTPGEWTADVNFINGTGRFELSALARSARTLTLGGAPSRRVGTSGPISVTLDGSGTPGEFRLIRMDGTVEQTLMLFDDGLHDDGEAGDRTWGATVTVDTPGEFRVAMDANDEAVPFSRETGRTVIVGLPEVASVDTLGLGTVAVGGSTTRVLYVRNVGVVPLVVTNVTLGSTDFAATPTDFTVRAGDAQRVDVAWTPSGTGPVSVTASVTSDDPDEPVHDLILTGAAVAPAILSYEPDTLAIALAQGDSVEVTLRLRNDGAGASAVVLSDPAGSTGPPFSGYHYQTAFGPGAGVPFHWETLGEDAITVGPLSLDGAAGPFPIGFNFPIYGSTATEFYISENGHMTLGGLPALFAYTFGPCPPSSYFAPYLAPYLENIDLRHSGRIRWHANSERLVVEYQDARPFDLNELDVPLNCQIVLYRDGSIDFNYETVPPTLFFSPLVAIGSGSNGESLSPSCEIYEPARDRTTIHFWRDNPWLDLSATADTLDGGDSLSVVVRVNALLQGFTVGETYEAAVTVLNDAPDSPRREIPVRLTVLPGPYSVAGRVTALEDSSGVPDAIVRAVGPYGSVSDTTDAAGQYLLAGLTSGGYAITAVSPLFLPSEPESLQVPAVTEQNIALTRPIINLDPASIEATVAVGDSICRQLVVQNNGTAPLVVDGLQRAETPPGLAKSDLNRTDYDFERVLDDPMFDSDGPDLLALDVARRSNALDFRLTLSDPLLTMPPSVFISLDTDRNPATGANPPALGYGLPEQNVGAEYELVFDNVCAGYVYLIDAVTGGYLTLYFLQAEDKAVRFTVPLADLGNDDGTMNVCVTSLPGICDGGSRRPDGLPEKGIGALPAVATRVPGTPVPRTGVPGTGVPGTALPAVTRSQSSSRISSIEAETDVTTFDWMPETGHGTIGSCSWLSLVPNEALLAPGESATFAVCIDARALGDTTLGCSVSLQSNDPRRPLAVLPVNVVVTSSSGATDLAAPSGSLSFALRQNDPNPFGDATRIRFTLPREERVRLSIFDLKGGLVQRVLDERRAAGEHEIVLGSLDRLSGGIYFYRLEAGGRVATRKMMLLK